MKKNTLLLGGAKAVDPENMADALQQAIEIEIATIPTYLYTYYSINRTPDQSAIQAAMLQGLLKTGMPKEDAEPKALEMSAMIMVYANKAGAVIMSVVVEEMLHMALSSNVKQAIAGMPDLVDKSPGEWPAYLPGHEPPFPINLAKYSLDQLYTFLQIESPKPITGKRDKATAIPYVTIGEFYGLIEKAIKRFYPKDDQYNTKAAQLTPGRGYYAHNNINTNYYNKEHKPQEVNANDSGDLIHVVDCKSALKALNEIVEQGEGAGGNHLNPDGSVNCRNLNEPGDFDDPKHKELAHFDKFNLLYCELKALQKYFQDSLQDPSFDVKSLFVVDVPLNPTTADYPAPVQDLSNLTNAVYSYVFIMTEACYRKAGNTQFEIFMMGIHKTMLWILSSLCSEMVSVSYIGSDGVTRMAGPTFENWEFNAASSPKQQVIALYNQAVGSNSSISYIGPRILDLPDVPVAPYQEEDPGKPILD